MQLSQDRPEGYLFFRRCAPGSVVVIDRVLTRSFLLAPDRLVEGVRTVAAGEALLAPVLTRRLIEEHVRRPPPHAGVPPQLEGLTERELDVLRLIARGLSNDEIAERHREFGLEEGDSTLWVTATEPTEPGEWLGTPFDHPDPGHVIYRIDVSAAFDDEAELADRRREA